MIFGWKPRASAQADWRAHLRDFRHLIIGRRYRVEKAFTDYDGVVHPVGETWRFEGHSFLPYESGLSLFVLPDGADTVHFRLRWEPEDQGSVIDALEDHVRVQG